MYREAAATEYRAPPRDELYHDYDDTATPVAEYKPRATQHTFHDDRVDLPLEEVEESVINAEVDVETCNACGNTLDAHTANCPRADKKPAAPMPAPVESETPMYAVVVTTL